jgi:hypothetical protein
MTVRIGQMPENIEPVSQIEPARIEALTGEIPDLLAELSAQAVE